MKSSVKSSLHALIYRCVAAHILLGETDKAVELLEQGVLATESAELQTQLDTISAPTLEPTPELTPEPTPQALRHLAVVEI